MARLPVPNSDDGTWGTILNDFLSQAHNADGTLKDIGVVAAKYTKPGVGIPKTDLTAAVQASLDNADAAAAGTLADGSVTTPKIADGAVTAAKIANTTITDTQISATAAIAQNKISGLTAALGSKEPTITAGTTGQYWRGDKTWQTLDKTAVGLANVDNTTDANKPVSTATQTALDAKAVDTAVVHNTGNETVAGIKTFSSSPIIPTPTTAAQATNKSYVDSTVSSVDAANVSNTPAGTIAATNVQAAINELDAEKAPIDNPAFTTAIQTPWLGVNHAARVDRLVTLEGTMPTGGIAQTQLATNATFGSGATQQATGISIKNATPAVSLTVGIMQGLLVGSPIVGAGSAITNMYGISVSAHTTGTNSYGIAIAAAGTQTLWVSSIADNTTIAAGIGFGLSRDTNLYRSAVATLATSGAFKTGVAPTGARPNAATVGAGAQFYDSTLSKPIWSDGTIWRDAAGTAA